MRQKVRSSGVEMRDLDASSFGTPYNRLFVGVECSGILSGLKRKRFCCLRDILLVLPQGYTSSMTCVTLSAEMRASSDVTEMRALSGSTCLICLAFLSSWQTFSVLAGGSGMLFGVFMDSPIWKACFFSADVVRVMSYGISYIYIYGIFHFSNIWKAFLLW